MMISYILQALRVRETNLEDLKQMFIVSVYFSFLINHHLYYYF